MVYFTWQGSFHTQKGADAYEKEIISKKNR